MPKSVVTLLSVLLCSLALTVQAQNAARLDALLPAEKSAIKEVSLPGRINSAHGLDPSRINRLGGTDKALPPLVERALRAPNFSPVKSEALGSEVSPLVIGGSDVPPGERGYQVSLQDEFGHFCGGALIDREWVLTAAHCMSPAFISFGFYAVMGSNDLLADTQVAIPALDVLVHPDFDPVTLNNDVAVVRLAEPAPEALPILQLADTELMDTSVSPGDLVTVSGWGVFDDSGELATSLQQADLPLLDQAACFAAYDEVGLEVTDQMICAGLPEGGVDSCNGDSGGPLTISVDGEDYSIGVVSWGYPGCAEPGFPGVYTRTSAVLEWITSAMASEPIAAQQLTLGDQPVVSAEEGDWVVFQFEVPETAINLEVSTFGGEGDADLLVFASPFIIDSALSCVSANTSSEESCALGLAAPGIYTVVMSAYTDFSDVSLSFNYQPAVLENGTQIDNVQLNQDIQVPLYLEFEEPVYNFNVSLAGGEGDADLFVLSLDGDETFENCFSTSTSSDEICEYDELPAGNYVIVVNAYTDFQGVTFSISWDEELPFVPLAICQHSVVTQVGQYFVAAVSVFNISEQYLNDWYVEWQYAAPAEVLLVYNGVLSGYEPFRASSAESGSAIAPLGSSTLYMLVRSPSGTAGNPPVTGNYCF